MSQTSWYVSGCLQQVSRCLQQNPGGIIGCRQHHCMSLDISSRSPGVSSGIQAVSLDVVNIDGCLAKGSSKSPGVSSENPGGIIGCCEARDTSLDVSSRSPGVTSRIQEVSLDVVNHMVGCWMSSGRLQQNPESSRYHWMSLMSWYVSGYLQQVSRCLPLLEEKCSKGYRTRIPDLGISHEYIFAYPNGIII